MWVLGLKSEERGVAWLRLGYTLGGRCLAGIGRKSAQLGLGSIARGGPSYATGYFASFESYAEPQMAVIVGIIGGQSQIGFIGNIQFAWYGTAVGSWI